MNNSGEGDDGTHMSPRVGRVPGRTYAAHGTPCNTQEAPMGLYISQVQEDTQELLETCPRVRYARPDVTETRGTCRSPSAEEKEWEETSLSFGYISRTPDLACPGRQEVSRPPKDAEGKQWTGTLAAPEEYQAVSPPSHHGSLCVLPQVTSLEARLSDALGLPKDEPWPQGRRLSRSLENLPTDIQEHILKCQCTCDHLGYGNFSSGSLARLTNGCSAHLAKSLATADPDGEDQPQNSSPTNKHKAESGFGVRTKVLVCVVLVLAAVAGVGVGVPLALRVDPGASLQQRLTTAKTLLRDTPLFDGHNDLPWNIRKFMHNKLHSFNFTAELKKLRPWSRSSWSHTDLPRLKEGMVGAQFWVSYVPCESQRLNAVQLTIEQIDLIKRLIDQYPDDLRLATSADDVEAAFKEGRIASLIGVEGGHAIQNSLGVLRALRDLGVRYMTLTHTCSTPWAECARAKETDKEDPNSPRGLTQFGKLTKSLMAPCTAIYNLSNRIHSTSSKVIPIKLSLQITCLCSLVACAADAYDMRKVGGDKLEMCNEWLDEERPIWERSGQRNLAIANLIHVIRFLRRDLRLLNRLKGSQWALSGSLACIALLCDMF
ncbi:uncharacterized protein [Panulirus ornatus]|uniref:uncharacterized protein n=1 Tax=Panulirus ornatus TaxID=150431 RepID=UPI003A83C67E